MVEIGLIAVSAQDRVIDLSAFAVDPADNVGILGEKSFKIDSDRTLLRTVLRHRVIGIFLMNIAGRSLFVLLLSHVILMEDRPETVTAKCDDRRENYDQNIGNGLSHFEYLIFNYKAGTLR